MGYFKPSSYPRGIRDSVIPSLAPQSKGRSELGGVVVWPWPIFVEFSDKRGAHIFFTMLGAGSIGSACVLLGVSRAKIEPTPSRLASWRKPILAGGSPGRPGRVRLRGSSKAGAPVS